MDYFSKMKGTTKSPPAVSLPEIFWSWIGSFAGIAAVALVNSAIVDKTDLVMINGGKCQINPRSKKNPQFNTKPFSGGFFSGR